MTETENQNVQKPEEMNNQNNNIKNEIRQRNAVLINQQTKRQIRDWLEGNPYQELLEYMKSRVMGQENIAIVVANVYNYLKNVSIPDTVMEMPTHGNCNNMILAAPSGSGKTETYRAFKDYFKKRIPALRLTISDVSNLTATGYRGAEPSSIVEPFLGCGLEPIGIVFMDEFDKICTPSYSANHGDVHLEVQHNLLTLVEGSRVETKQGYVNTNKLLFIGMGSFDQFRKKRENDSKEPIGFGASGSDEIMEAEHAAPITREDMISAGGCYELIGRFSYVENYHSLDQKTIIEIIKQNCEKIADDFDCEIELAEPAMKELCDQANSKFGCRLIESMIRDIVLRAYSEALESGENGDVLVVTIITLQEYEYRFRAYEEEDIPFETTKMTGNNNGCDADDKISVQKMSFEERMEALIRAQTQQE